jgi:uncharacterized protein
MFTRLQTFKRAKNSSLFFWGARQTGKSTLLKNNYEDALLFDLLKDDTLQTLLRRPSALREIVESYPNKNIIIIDEVQKIPALLNEVHWLIENAQKKFILTGSSPRKIINSGQNLLGGRALTYKLFPLTTAEVPNLNLNKALLHGLLPNHYLSKEADLLIAAYVTSYLQEEIAQEARIRNLSLFLNFLQKAALTNGEFINYSNIAADCGVSSPTVKEYFKILEDTMLGSYIQPYQKNLKRKVTATSKFYFFDTGIVNYLLKQKNLEPGTPAFGKAFEHFIFMELTAYKLYMQKDFDISFWHTSTKLEVDFILGDAQIAIEVKSTHQVQSKHLKNIKSFMAEANVQQAIVVCNELFPRMVNGILILPWQHFSEKLWGGGII